MSQMLILAVYGGGNHDAPIPESLNPAISEIAFFGHKLAAKGYLCMIKMVSRHSRYADRVSHTNIMLV